MAPCRTSGVRRVCTSGPGDAPRTPDAGPADAGGRRPDAGGLSPGRSRTWRRTRRTFKDVAKDAAGPPTDSPRTQRTHDGLHRTAEKRNVGRRTEAGRGGGPDGPAGPGRTQTDVAPDAKAPDASRTQAGRGGRLDDPTCGWGPYNTSSAPLYLAVSLDAPERPGRSEIRETKDVT